jgi:hypothetical protein
MQTKPKQHPLKGKWMHILSENGEIHNQGFIKDVSYSGCTIQRFSYMTGDPTDIIKMTIDDVLNTKLALVYATKLDFHWSYFYRTWTNMNGRGLANDWMWYCDCEEIHSIKEGLDNG